MSVLTVLLAPHTEAEEILAVLSDYSAVGLLSGFVWVDSADAGAASLPATVVRDGLANPVVLQQIVAAQRFERLRLAVLVPLEVSPVSRVPLAVELQVEQIMRFGAMGAPITLLRLLYTHGAAAAVTADPSAVLEGWHNLLIAPEDSAGPGLASVTLDRLTDPLDVARHVARSSPAPPACGRTSSARRSTASGSCPGSPSARFAPSTASSTPPPSKNSCGHSCSTRTVACRCPAAAPSRSSTSTTCPRPPAQWPRGCGESTATCCGAPV